MFRKRDVVVFLAGAEAFHTLAHIVIAYSGTLPIKFFFIEWTSQLNLYYGIGLNALVTIALLWWASKLK